ncbi:SEL1-like repeat protein [Amphritea atlantica]|nr:SEL1-like repeat protein [Amphritea atlantica]
MKRIIFFVSILFSSVVLSDESNSIDICELSKKSIKHEEARSYYIYGDCLYKGAFGQRDPEQAVEMWQKAIMLGDTQAALYLGVHWTFLSKKRHSAGPLLLKMSLRENKLKASRYLGLYFLDDGSRLYSSAPEWALYYLNNSYKEGDYISAYLIAYAVENKLFNQDVGDVSDWIKRGENLDSNKIGYNRVIAELKGLGFIDERIGSEK